MMLSGFGGFESWRSDERKNPQQALDGLDARKASLLRREAAICRSRGDYEAAAACDAGADHFDPSGQVGPA